MEVAENDVDAGVDLKKSLEKMIANKHSFNISLPTLIAASSMLHRRLVAV